MRTAPFPLQLKDEAVDRSLIPWRDCVDFSVFATLFTVFVTVFLLSGCGKPADHRQAQRDQNEANAAAQMADLKNAEGIYQGVMKMTKSHKSYVINLSVQRIYQNVRTPSGSDPTQTINIPKLSGYLSFPVLDKLDVGHYGTYEEITDAMGGYATALFDFGDYDPNTNLMVLPYNVSGFAQGNFGELSGQLVNGLYTGTWFAKPLGQVGTFMLQQIATQPTQEPKP